MQFMNMKSLLEYIAFYENENAIHEFEKTLRIL